MIFLPGLDCSILDSAQLKEFFDQEISSFRKNEVKKFSYGFGFAYWEIEMPFLLFSDSWLEGGLAFLADFQLLGKLSSKSQNWSPDTFLNIAGSLSNALLALTMHVCFYIMKIASGVQFLCP